MNCINYYNKYIKYKSKYLEIKKQVGGIPFRDIIFEIPEIADPKMNLYLNPLFGFVYYSNGFIFNYKYFYSEILVGKLINKDRIFFKVGNTIKPSNNLLDYISCEEIGIIIGILYLLYIKKEKDECIIKLLDNYPIHKTKKKLNNQIYNSFKICEDQEILIDLFRLMLVILWWKINNKNDIKEYFYGLKQIITSLELKQETEEINEFKHLFIKTLSPIELTEMGQAKHFCTNVVYIESGINLDLEEYPNCGENVLNNLFNILAYFYEDNFVYKLESLNANPKLINYYKTFTKENINEEIDFYCKISNFISAWSYVVSNLDGVKYNTKGIRDGDEYKFEIESGLNLKKNKLNILQVISELIPGVNSWEEFISKFTKDNLIFEIIPVIDSDGLGYITITINNLKFKITLIKNHYEITDEIKIKVTDIRFNSIKQENLKNLIFLNFRKSENFEKDFKYIKWKNNNLVNLINEDKKISDILYTKIIDYFIDYLTNNEFLQIYRIIDFNKIINKELILKKIKILILNQNNKEFLYNAPNLIELYINYNEPLDCSLFTLIKLEKLNLYNYNQPLEGSLSTLTKLKELNLYNYNQPLEGSLSTLTKLKELNLYNYTQPLNGSLSTLTKLKELNLYNYTQPLNGSLSTLINLYNLNLYNYNQPLNGSLSTLINLYNLNLYNYNQPLEGSLSTLINLNELNLNFYNQPLEGSLSMLTKLTNLNLRKYTKPLEGSLSTLVKLKILNLNSYDENLNNSLSTLTNLNELKLYNYKKPLEDSLSTLINLNELLLCNYNQRLDCSLSTLIKLEKLYLNNYNEPLSDSISMVTNLTELNLSNYNHPLDSFLFTLIKLKELNLSKYNQLLISYSLSKLSNLETLFIPLSSNFRRDNLTTHYS